MNASEVPSALGEARSRPFRLRAGLLALIVASLGLTALWAFHAPIFNGLIMVRAAPDDTFEPEGWWRERGNSREVLIESMRWVNSFWFGDFWRRRE